MSRCERVGVMLFVVSNFVLCVSHVWAQCAYDNQLCCYSVSRCKPPDDQDGCNVDAESGYTIKIISWSYRSVCSSEFAQVYDVCALDQDASKETECANGKYYENKADCEANTGELGDVKYTSSVCCGSTICSVSV